MKEKIVNIADYIVKFFAMLISAYVICTYVYKNIHINISMNILMWGMIGAILLDYILYICGNYAENVLENKIIRGIIWCVTISLCDIKGIIVLLIATLLFFVFLSNERRTYLDIPFIFMISCASMEAISVIGILFDSEYRIVARALNNSLVIDFLLIFSVIIYIYADKFQKLISKIPSIEKEKQLEIYSNDGTEDILKKIIYVAIIFLSVVIGLHMYSSLCVNTVFVKILSCALIIVLLVGVLCAIYNELYNNLNIVYKLIISIGVVCLPYINYNNFTTNLAVIYLFSFVLVFCVLELLKNYKYRWHIAFALLIIESIVMFIQGVYIIPILNILIGIVLGKIIQNNLSAVIGLCTVFIVCSQCVVAYKYIEPIRKYDGIINETSRITKEIDVNVFYTGADSRTVEMLQENGISCKNSNDMSNNESGLLIFDKSVEEKYILHKYITYEDEDYIVCLSDEGLAEKYSSAGGECTRKECDAKIDVINYDTKTKKADIILSDVTDGYHDLSAAVWCEEKSSNKKVWYDLKDNGNGSFEATIDLKKYSKNDEITIHVYGTFEDEDDSFVAGTTYVRE